MLSPAFYTLEWKLALSKMTLRFRMKYSLNFASTVSYLLTSSALSKVNYWKTCSASAPIEYINALTYTSSSSSFSLVATLYLENLCFQSGQVAGLVKSRGSGGENLCMQMTRWASRPLLTSCNVFICLLSVYIRQDTHTFQVFHSRLGVLFFFPKTANNRLPCTHAATCHSKTDWLYSIHFTWHLFQNLILFFSQKRGGTTSLTSINQSLQMDMVKVFSNKLYVTIFWQISFSTHNSSNQLPSNSLPSPSVGTVLNPAIGLLSDNKTFSIHFYVNSSS